MAQLINQHISPEHSCWDDWDTKSETPEACKSGKCNHTRIQVNFEDVTKDVRKPVVRKALVAAQMWCTLLDVEPVAISIEPVHNHPGQRYERFVLLYN
jgi:hypothetical protein